MRIVLDPSAKSFEKVMVLSRLFLADIGIEITAGGPQVYVNSKEGGAQQFTMHSRFLVELRPEQAARLLELNLKLWNLYTVTTNVRTPYIMKLAHFQIGEIMNGCRKGHMFLTRFNLEHLGPIDRVEIRDSYCQP
jgi:hypothetical protein